jgi:hypothetical protein
MTLEWTARTVGPREGTKLTDGNRFQARGSPKYLVQGFSAVEIGRRGNPGPGDAGRGWRFCSRCWRRFGRVEVQESKISSGRRASLLWRLSYNAAGSLPGDPRPQLPRGGVSPETNVRTGAVLDQEALGRRVTGRMDQADPDLAETISSPLSRRTRSDSEAPVIFLSPSPRPGGRGSERVARGLLHPRSSSKTSPDVSWWCGWRAPTTFMPSPRRDPGARSARRDPRSSPPGRRLPSR